jgi:hypothetical protein
MDPQDINPLTYSLFEYRIPAGLTVWSFRIAGIYLLVNLVVELLLMNNGLVFIFLHNFSYLPCVIDFILAIALLFHEDLARIWTIVRLVFGILFFLTYGVLVFFPDMDYVIMFLIQLGLCASIYLILSGGFKPWRMTVSMAIFAIFDLCLSIVLHVRMLSYITV